MAIDSPAKIVVLGAGPIGLEAALYARFLGYEIEVIERGDVADNVQAWRHVRMFTPFEQNSTPLALAALEAQGDYKPPDPAAMLTGGEFADGYLLPLSKSDLLDDAIHTRTEVIQISRANTDPGFLSSDDDLADESDTEPTDDNFTIVTRDEHGVERVLTSAAVIDTTEIYGKPCGLSANGEFIEGQLAVSEQIDYRLPDISGSDRENFDGKRVLIVGSGEMAALAVMQLSTLCSKSSETRITWLVVDSGAAGLASSCPGQVLVERAKQIVESSTHIDLIPSGEIQSIGIVNGTFQIGATFNGGETSHHDFDRVISCANSKPDDSIWQGIDVEAESLTADDARTAEPNVYVVGRKRFGRRKGFLLSDGHQQIRKLFSIIGDRADLDLYRTIKPLS